MLSSSLKPSAGGSGGSNTSVLNATSQSEMLGLSSAKIGDLCLRSDAGVTYVLAALPASSTSNWKLLTYIYDISGCVVGKPSDGAVLTRFIASRAFSLPANLANSLISSSTASSSTSTLVLKKNGIQFGQFSWAAAGTVPTTMSTHTDFAVGDVLTVEQQGAADATLADIQYTLVAALS